MLHITLQLVNFADADIKDGGNNNKTQPTTVVWRNRVLIHKQSNNNQGYY